MSELTKDLKQQAILELHEVPEEREQHVIHIRHWIEEHCSFNIEADPWILNFLRGCKFDLEKTKAKLELLNRLKISTPEIFSNRDPFLLEIQDILSRGAFIPISHASAELILMRWKDLDPNKNRFVDILKVAFMLTDLYLLENSEAAIKGIHVTVDFRGFSLNYLKEWNISVLKNISYIFFKASPARVKSFTVINAPNLLSYVFKVFKLFLSKKIVSRINIYSCDDSKIYRDIAQSIFPKEYGGQGESIETIKTNLKERFESHRDWFMRNDINIDKTG